MAATEPAYTHLATTSPRFDIRPPKHERICAVVITYHPDDGLLDRLRMIAAQIRHVIVVDNGSPVAALQGISTIPGALLVRNASNKGIARALNQGFECAEEGNFEWVLTLDQDSEILPTSVEILSAAHNAFPNPERVALVGSRMRSPPDQPTIESRFPKAHTKFIRATTVITSGSLTAMAAHQAIGGFREDLFIDGVDHDYCLRLRRAGYEVIQTTEYSLVHRWGKPEIRQVLWKRFNVSNHSPVRRYYIARNRLLVAKDHFRDSPGWAAISLLALIKGIVLTMSFEKQKLAKLRASARGIADALRGKSGEIPQTLARWLEM